MACCNLTSPELSARSVAQRSLGSWTSPSRPRPCRRSYATVTTAATGTRGHVNERGLAVKLSSIRSRDVIANAAKASEAATLIRKDTSGPAPVIGAEPVEEPVNFKMSTYVDIYKNSQKPLAERERGLIIEADRSKELSRLYRRNVYGFDEWREHRSVARYLRHMAGFTGSGIVRGLSGPLNVVLFISLTITIYETLRDSGQLPPTWISLSVNNPAAFNFSSFALSLLLVFRTNSSYGRWDEARKMWGSLVNRMRDLVRQAESWFPDDDPELLNMMVRWCSAFPHVLQSHLRETNTLRSTLKDVLKPDELEALMATTHRPNFVLSVISRTIDEAQLPTMARLRCDENLTNFADVCGGCERILKTPIPLSYTRHTARFLIIFLAFLPFALWHACGWATVPASLSIAFLLLGIEEIGVQIEEPFGILPLEVISATIQRNCEEMHARRGEVQATVTSVTQR